MDELLAEREKTHGPFWMHAHITQGIKSVMHFHKNWRGLNDSKREALDMIAHKIGRILAGDPNHADHWLDIAGYATLVVKELESHGKKVEDDTPF